MARQLSLPLPKWGGRREGAGRPRTRPHPGLVGPGVPHLAREEINSRHPVHVTMRVQPGVGYLRVYRRAQLLEDAFREARLRFGMRIIHYSIQGNHLHLLVEVDSAESLSRGMQGLAIRVAKGSMPCRAAKAPSLPIAITPARSRRGARLPTRSAMSSATI